MPIIKDQKSLERVAGEMAFSRGKVYNLKGMVKSVAHQGDILEGDVRGSGQEMFHVRIRMKGLHDFKRAECSCPFKWSSMCKHAVAVLLHWMHYVAITEKVDLENVVILTEKQLKLNADIVPLPVEELPLEEETTPVVKKVKKNDYLLPEYQYRSPQKPLIRIVLSTVGFIGGVIKNIPFKIFIVNGDQEAPLTNFKVFFSGTRSNVPPISAFSSRQQYVLNFLNELLNVDTKESVFTQPQFRIKRMQWAIYLGAMANCPGIEFLDSKTNQKLIVNTTDKLSLTIHVRLIEKGQWGIKATLRDSRNPQRDFGLAHLQEGHPVWVFDENASSFEQLHEGITYSFLTDFLNTERILDDQQLPYFISSILNPLREYCEVIDENECLKQAFFIAPVLRCRIHLDYVKNCVRAKLSFGYENQEAYHYEGNVCIDRFTQVSKDDGFVWIVRDIDQENAKVQHLLSECAFEWKKNAKLFEISNPDDILALIYDKLPAMRRDMDVICSEEFDNKLLKHRSFEPVLQVMGNGIDWFQFETVYKAEGIDEEISHARIKKLVLDGQKYIRLKKGELLPIPKEFYDRIETMEAEFDTKKLHIAQMPFVMEEIKRNNFKSTIDPVMMAVYEELKSFKSVEEVVIPEPLSGVLRDYQRKGVDWLVFLKKFKFSGILADEMGLGKTLQALTLLQMEIVEGAKLPSLVICPTTLAWNWQEEIKKFLPNVSVLVLNGNHRRELFDQINKAQVVITSYPLLRRDIELYKKISFNYVILDEAQNIKNRNTQNAQVAKELRSVKRLAMTGTPIENSMMDLWSIFDFLMPGFLGSAEKFKKNYEIPITKFQDKEQLTKLSGKILPFVLRRLKKDVIKDLPEKIEQVSYCELEPTQAKIYEEMIQSARDIASKSVKENGFEKSRMVILTLILRLRQICCHPLIAGVDLGHRSVSGKMELLKETIAELLASNHKVLIFSQFVSMLSIMEDYLKREQITYAYMDGSSKDRQQEVERFNSNPSLRVFLLSLKVGGVGLNLTSADTVIIYEPWWNPAVENQAIDRVHRIGQQSSVLAYRMITKGTIEEKMLELQNRKKYLVDSLVLSEETIGKKLDWEDIKFLLDMK